MAAYKPKSERTAKDAKERKQSKSNPWLYFAPFAFFAENGSSPRPWPAPGGEPRTAPSRG